MWGEFIKACLGAIGSVCFYAYLVYIVGWLFGKGFKAATQ